MWELSIEKSSEKEMEKFESWKREEKNLNTSYKPKRYKHSIVQPFLQSCAVSEEVGCFFSSRINHFLPRPLR